MIILKLNFIIFYIFYILIIFIDLDSYLDIRGYLDVWADIQNLDIQKPQLSQGYSKIRFESEYPKKPRYTDPLQP